MAAEYLIIILVTISAIILRAIAGHMIVDAVGDHVPKIHLAMTP